MVHGFGFEEVVAMLAEPGSLRWRRWDGMRVYDGSGVHEWTQGHRKVWKEGSRDRTRRPFLVACSKVATKFAVENGMVVEYVNYANDVARGGHVLYIVGNVVDIDVGEMRSEVPKARLHLLTKLFVARDMVEALNLQNGDRELGGKGRLALKPEDFSSCVGSDEVVRPVFVSVGGKPW